MLFREWLMRRTAGGPRPVAGTRPGQVFFVVAVVMLFIGVATWYANKR